MIVGRKKSRPAIYLLLGIVATFLVFFPILWLISTSLRPAMTLSQQLKDSLLFKPTLSHYITVFQHEGFLGYMLNSIIIAFGTTFTSIAVASLCAYSLARMDFPGKRLIGRLILFTYLVPPVLLVIPLFRWFMVIKLTDTLLGLIVAHTTFSIPFCIWLLRSFFLDLPKDLEDSALIDGTNRLGALFRIVLPLSLPGLVATAMFSFILSWNEYFFAVILINSEKARPLALGLTTAFRHFHMTTVDYSTLMAASTLSSLPTLIFFLFLQGYLLRGLTAGAVKA